MNNFIKLVCINEYSFSEMTIEVGDIIEVENLGYAYSFEDENGIHHVTTEPDSEGVSYKTWFERFEEVDSNE